MSDPNEDLKPVEALTELLASDGWKLFQQAMAEQWGPSSQLRQIDRALEAIPPGDQEAVNQTVQQIRSSGNAINNALRWPSEQLQRLKATERKGFPGFRRRA